MNMRIDTDGPDARKTIENAIEHLLTLLDNMDGDPDLELYEDDEDGHDTEPELGWTEDGNTGSTSLSVLDGEPSLGWSEAESEAGIQPTGYEFPDGPPLAFKGDGIPEARALLTKAGPRIEPRTIGERVRVLQTGELFRTAVLADSGYVVRRTRRRR